MSEQAMDGHPFRQEALILKGNQHQATTNPTKHPTSEQDAKPRLVEGVDFEAISSGKVVWVNDATGMCLGRFSAAGVDVHRTAAEQQAGLPQCLDCIHDLPSHEAWPRFRASMLAHHGIFVSGSLHPAFASLPSTTSPQE